MCFHIHNLRSLHCPVKEAGLCDEVVIVSDAILAFKIPLGQAEQQAQLASQEEGPPCVLNGTEPGLTCFPLSELMPIDALANPTLPIPLSILSIATLLCIF